MNDTKIADVAIVAGHDGSAELAIRLDYGNQNYSDIVLDERAVKKLMADCGASEVGDLVGESWQRIANLTLSD